MNRFDKLPNRFVRQCHIKLVLTAASIPPISLLVRKGTLDLLRKFVLSKILL